jgi:hypothetical protein
MNITKFFYINENRKIKILYVVAAVCQSVPLLYLLSTRYPFNSFIFLFTLLIFLLTITSAFIHVGRDLMSEPTSSSKIKIFLLVILASSIITRYFYMLFDTGYFSSIDFFSGDNRFGGFLFGLFFGRNRFQRLINGLIVMQTLGAIDWMVIAARNSTWLLGASSM